MDLKTVFITREVSADSLFQNSLAAAGYRVSGKSLIDFEPVPFEAVPAADWVFFYSRRAVGFFFEGLKKAGVSLAPSVRQAVLGPGTRKALEEEGLTPDFTGAGRPGDVARQFLEVGRHQRVLFPRAQHSQQTLQRKLEKEIIALDLIVYDNRPSDSVPAEHFDVLVFTSPINARAYYAKRQRQPGQRVFAIGPTTAAALRQLGIEQVDVPEQPSEEALARLVLRKTGT